MIRTLSILVVLPVSSRLTNGIMTVPPPVCQRSELPLILNQQKMINRRSFDHARQDRLRRVADDYSGAAELSKRA